MALTDREDDWELLPELRAALAAENDADGLFATLTDTRKDLGLAPADLTAEDGDEEEDEGDGDEEDRLDLDAIAFYVGEDEETEAYRLEYLAASKAVDALVASYRPADGIEKQASEEDEEEQAGEDGEDSRVDFGSIEALLRRSILRILRALGSAVPRDVFREVVEALIKLQCPSKVDEEEGDAVSSSSGEQLSYFVSMVVSFAELAGAEPTAVAHIGERFPAGLWLFYTKWFLVVYRITAAFPWLGDPESSGFWLVLDAAAATTIEQTRILNALEALVDKEFAEQDENEQEVDVDDQEEGSSELARTLAAFSLQELALMLNFTAASQVPAQLKDLPRLSRQANRRKLVQALCGANHVVQDLLFTADPRSDLMRRLQVKFGICLYYVEKIESAHDLEITWGDGIVTAWANEFSKRACSGAIEQDGATLGKALIEMMESLRRMFQLPHRDSLDIRCALQNVERLRGPAETCPIERSVKNLTLGEVLEQLRKAASLDEDILQVVYATGTALLSARSGDQAGIEEGDEDTRQYRAELRCLDSAVRKVMGFYLYPVQLVSIICGSMSGASSADQSEHQTALATILQMETGEGKSITFAVLAAFHARTGKKVDVATSNDQLAQDGAASAAPLFQELGVTWGVAGSTKSAAQECYSQQVVYSTISTLAGDYLREIIFQQNGRGKREFDVILADEVDAMLVDNASNMTMLSIPVAGIDKLYFLYASVYQRVKQTMEIEGANAAVPDQADPDFREQLGLPFTQPKESESDESGSSRPPQVLPKELLSLCDKKLAVYLDQCWMAQAQMKRGREYDIVQDKVVVIENKTSGEYQAQSVYGDGLHQFLQIQHSCELTPESLNSIFISNGAFARKYTEFVGLTGTIGGALDQEALVKSLIPTVRRTQDAERVRFVFLPRSKWRPFTLFPPLVFDDPNTATEYCMREIQWCRAAGRPVLLVSQDKATAENVASDLKSRHELQESAQCSNVKLYIINDPTLQTFSAVSDSLQPGDIVVSTTYGGRGTDYKLTAEAEKNGGLHTIVTFQAASERLQNQIFGRSARAGVPGSGVLITHNRFLLSSSTDFESRRIEYSELTESQYHQSLADQLKSNVPLNEGCDVLFQSFVGTYAKAATTVKSLRIQRGLHWYILEAVRNRFGILMEELKYEIVVEERQGEDEHRLSGAAMTQRMVGAFDKWESQIFADLTKGDQVITNPRAMVVYAKEIARRADSKARGYEWKDVQRVLDRAITDDGFMAGPPAHLLRLKAMFKTKKRNARLDADYDAVKERLEAALAAINYETEYYGAVSGLINADAKANISAQLTRTIDILMCMHSSVEEARQVLEEAHKKKGDSDDDKFYLELTFDDLPSEMAPKLHATFKEMCQTGGYIGLPRLKEEREWSWDWNAFGCLLLGMAQVIGGSVLMLLSAGVCGMGLIAEGVSDFVTSLISVIKGDGSFSWASYFQNKLISLAISLVCTGVCKLGKSLWNAGKAMFKNGLTLAKSGWKRMLQSAAKGVRNTITRAKQHVSKHMSKVVKAVKAPSQALRKGMVKCGNKLGRELVKQVVITGVNHGVDEGLKAVFNELQKKINEGVRRDVESWLVQHEAGLRKFCALKGPRGPMAYKAIVDLSEARMFQPQSQTMALLRRFGESLMGTICEELNNHSSKTGNTRHALLATSLKVFMEGAKWTEVIVQVTTFVSAWLQEVKEECERELAHVCCVRLEADIDPHRDAIESLGIETHTLKDLSHLQLTKQLEKSDLVQFEEDKKLLDDLRFAQYAFKQADEFDKSEASGELGNWDERELVIKKLTELASVFIRDKLEA